MGSFAKFINEGKRISDLDRSNDVANSIIRLHNMKSNKDYKFIDVQKFKNTYGKLEGYLYIAGTEGLRINFKNDKLHSISLWEKYGSYAPDRTILIDKDTDKKNLLNLYNNLKPGLDMKIHSLHYFTPKTHDAFISVTPFMEALKDNGPWHPKQLTRWLAVWDISYRQFWDFCDLGEYSDDAVFKYTKENIDEFEQITKQDIEWLEDQANKVNNEYQRRLDGEFEDVEDVKTVEPEVIENVEVVSNVKEEVEDNPYSVESDEDLASQLIADPLPVFRQLNTYALMVARGLNNALLITGQGGVGKSYNVNKILSTYGKKGVDYVIMKGKSSVSAMYKFLYDNYDKIVVFDDCDSVLQNNDGLNILKGVLDSGDVREVSWNTSGSCMVDTFGCETHEEIEQKIKAWEETHKNKVGIPNYFRFMGACIFISNLSRSDLEKSPSMQALLGRCTAVDIQLMASDIILRIESVLPQKKIYNTRGQDISDPAIKEEVFEFMKSPEFMEDPRIKNANISFRLFDKIYMFRYAGLPNWKEMAYCV